jgi:hypothetical protein
VLVDVGEELALVALGDQRRGGGGRGGGKETGDATHGGV